MGFGFKEKGKEKDLRKRSDHAKTLSPIGRPKSPLSLASTIRFDERHQQDRPTSSHSSLFSLHKPKSLKKKKSSASLLTAASKSAFVEPASPEPLQPTRAPSSDGSSQSHLVTSIASLTAAHKEKSARAAAQDLRKEEYRQLQLQGPKPRPPNTTCRKTIWAKRHNMKVHTHQGQAVYMQAYDPILLENDRHLDILLRRLNPLENPSFHDYGRKVPFFVLDVGCGAGHWLLDAANCWSQSSITGFDMVDILAPQVRNNDRIIFTRGNFLKAPWPFPAKTFDLVRMANLSLCIPYDKWEAVISEAHRVLTIDGRLELIDDEIFFPYAPPLVTPPSPSQQTSISPTPPKPRILTRGTSFFDMDGEDEDDADSLNTDSTLIGDGDSPASPSWRKRFSFTGADNKRKSLEKPLPVFSPKVSLEDPHTPTSATTIKPVDSTRPSEWSAEVAASRDMETVFQGMLHKKYGVHSQPSEFVVGLMEHVFGNGEKLKSFHLKLAPKDAHLDFPTLGGSDSTEGEERHESKKAGGRLNEITRRFNTSDADKEEKRRLKRLNKATTPTAATAVEIALAAAPPPDRRLPEGLSAKAAIQLGIGVPDVPSRELEKDTGDKKKRIRLASKVMTPTITPNAAELVLAEAPPPDNRIPEGLSAKAAMQLGIDVEEKKEKEDVLSPPTPLSTSDTDSESDMAEDLSPALSPASLPTEDPAINEDESGLSTKAAHRLDAYSILTDASATTKGTANPPAPRPQSSSSTLISPNPEPFQSPGLIVWPSMFIPLSPIELEMHACKNVHTLIGCKPALAEYISTFLDEDGNRIESDEGFDEALWDYECFRRRRFNWPSEIPEWDSSYPEASALDSAPTSKSGDTPKSANLSSSRNNRGSMHISDGPWTLASDAAGAEPTTAHHQYKNHDLAHVRTLRVYQAIKMGEYSLSTLQYPRSSPLRN
ncbi:hypothetical protein H0H81_004531 [Sphagnurus paluster]|uniref:Methyltransferase domain-containing protein n=1 Tax=Sphagnurus paluster TaxID=117069 RepID=A0A9P7KHE6_9AGAR|nr:hypothetical protein H0H81_004531 [Sphagnurus paluster]